MCNHESTAPDPNPSADAQSPEFEARILAAIEEAERTGKLLLLLSANDKRLLFLELQDLRSGLGFIKGVHRRWPDSPEKREQAVQVWIRHGLNLFPEREILNEDDLKAYLRDAQNAVANIDLTGRVETVKLLIGAFRKIAESLFTAWRRTPDPRCEEFNNWIRFIRLLVIEESCAEWPGRRLAIRESEPGTPPEFEGLPPLWFDHLPLTDVDGLKKEADRWINKARAFERKRRRAEAAAETVLSEPVAAPAPAEVPAALATAATVDISAGTIGPPPVGETGKIRGSPRGSPILEKTKETLQRWHDAGKPKTSVLVKQMYPNAKGKERRKHYDRIRQAISRAQKRERPHGT